MMSSLDRESLSLMPLSTPYIPGQSFSDHMLEADWSRENGWEVSTTLQRSLSRCIHRPMRQERTREPGEEQEQEKGKGKGRASERVFVFECGHRGGIWHVSMLICLLVFLFDDGVDVSGPKNPTVWEPVSLAIHPRLSLCLRVLRRHEMLQGCRRRDPVVSPRLEHSKV